MIDYPKWAWSGSRDPFLHYEDQAIIIYGADEARHFKFGLQTERKEYCHDTC